MVRKSIKPKWAAFADGEMFIIADTRKGAESHLDTYNLKDKRVQIKKGYGYYIK